MRGKVLSRVGAQCNLGVLMLDTASFSDHIHTHVNKANKMLGFICRTVSTSKITNSDVRLGLCYPSLANEHLKRLNLLPVIYCREVKDLSTFYKLMCRQLHVNSSFIFYFQFCSDERLRSHTGNKLKINS